MVYLNHTLIDKKSFPLSKYSIQNDMNERIVRIITRKATPVFQVHERRHLI